MKTAVLVLTVSLLTCATGLLADTAESYPFIANMTTANEVPATTVNARGNALIWVHVIRDPKGNIASGSVDFNVAYNFATPTSIVGLHIHGGAAGANGSVLIDTGISAAAPLTMDPSGKAVVSKQVQFPGAPNPTLAVIQDLLANPAGYYVNLHTPENPGGAIRSQLAPADMKILMGVMSPANEVPPVTGVTSSGIPTVTVFRNLDNQNNVTSAWVTFALNYTGFAADAPFTGFHIHSGAAGTNGPVIINTGITGATAGSSGAGSLLFNVPVSPSDATFAAEAATVNGLFDNPNGYYINIHTMANPGGEMRAQLRNTDRMDFQVNMLPANEVPAITGLNASGSANMSFYTLRGPDGAIVAGTTVFDVNFRGFPAGTSFTGLHIHDGNAATNGAVTINTGVATGSLISDSGSGNAYKVVTVSAAPGIATLNSISLNPENAYVNMHTTVNAGGAMRCQIGPAIAVLPQVNAVTSNPDTKTATLAPGEIFSLYGLNLAKYTSDLGGTYQLTALPSSLNGVSVTVGGKTAPLYFVAPFQINGQVPVDVANGQQPVVVTNANGASTPLNVPVAVAAPAIYVDAGSGAAAILRNADYSLVASDNPARAGDVLLVYLTGLGQTTPPLATGSLQSGATLNRTGPVTATIGGKDAPVVYSIASPGFAGLYQVALTVPAGVNGKSQLVIFAGPAASNTVSVPVQ